MKFNIRQMLPKLRPIRHPLLQKEKIGSKLLRNATVPKESSTKSLGTSKLTPSKLVASIVGKDHVPSSRATSSHKRHA
jgi:hypothetical protein